MHKCLQEGKTIWFVMSVAKQTNKQTGNYLGTIFI